MNKLIKNFRNISTKKKKGSKEVMVELGMAVVAIILIVVFRDKIKDLIDTLGTFVSNKIQDIFNGI